MVGRVVRATPSGACGTRLSSKRRGALGAQFKFQVTQLRGEKRTKILYDEEFIKQNEFNHINDSARNLCSISIDNSIDEEKDLSASHAVDVTEVIKQKIVVA